MESHLKQINTELIGLVKIGEKNNLDELSKGKLYCRRIDYYRKLENQGKAYYDPDEGIKAIFQAEHIEVIISGKNIAPVKLTRETGLTKQVKIKLKKNAYAFCLYAFHTDGWDGGSVNESNLKQFRNFLSIDSEMKKYGNLAWLILNIEEFNEKLKTICGQKNISFEGNLVTYIDYSVYHSDIEDTHYGFVKDISFSKEREYRYLFYPQNESKESFILDVGNLQDITTILSLDELIDKFEVRLKSGND